MDYLRRCVALPAPGPGLTLHPATGARGYAYGLRIFVRDYALSIAWFCWPEVNPDRRCPAISFPNQTSSAGYFQCGAIILIFYLDLP
ncbi:hypothetical protein ACFDAU_12170 [Sulfuriferula sp. GW1]|uniref:hypothetical protein n=1 Tax=Sulfuriferula sp. GW1 TaxID=3345111 RepID=UPI0039B082C2